MLPAVFNVAAGSFLVFTESSSTSTWIGYWSTTGLYLSVYSFAIAGALGAIAGARTGLLVQRRVPLLRRQAVDSRSAVAMPLLATLAWMWLSLAVVMAVAAARTLSYNTQVEWRALLLVALGASSCALATSFGFLLACLVRHRWSLLAAAPAPYGLTYIAGRTGSHSAGWRSYLFAPFIDAAWDPNLAPNAVTLGLFIAYTLALAVFLATIALRALNSQLLMPASPSALALSGVATATSAALVIISWSPNVFATQTRAEYACTEIGRSGYCLWSSQTWVQPQWSQAVASFTRTLGASAENITFLQYGLPARGPTELSIDQSTSVPSTAALTTAMFEAWVAFTSPSCPATGERSSVLQALTAAAAQGTAVAPESLAC